MKCANLSDRPIRSTLYKDRSKPVFQSAELDYMGNSKPSVNHQKSPNQEIRHMQKPLSQLSTQMSHFAQMLKPDQTVAPLAKGIWYYQDIGEAKWLHEKAFDNATPK